MLADSGDAPPRVITPHLSTAKAPAEGRSSQVSHVVSPVNGEGGDGGGGDSEVVLVLVVMMVMMRRAVMMMVITTAMMVVATETVITLVVMVLLMVTVKQVPRRNLEEQGPPLLDLGCSEAPPLASELGHPCCSHGWGQWAQRGGDSSDLVSQGHSRSKTPRCRERSPTLS